MSANHSQGPWRVKGTRIYDCAPGIDCIATMQVSNQPGWVDDAKLIAAAPELLKALQDLVDVMTGQMEGEAAFHNALAAIAKATGSAA